MNDKNIFVETKLKNFDEAIDFISNYAFKIGFSNNKDMIKEDILSREKEMNTCLLEPFAIPHAKSESIVKSGIFILRNNQFIDWNGMKARIMVVILSKKGENEKHIEQLSVISRKLVHEDFRNMLLNADVNEIITKLKNMEV